MSAAGTIGSAALAVKSFPAVKQEIGYYMAKYQCKTVDSKKLVDVFGKTVTMDGVFVGTLLSPVLGDEVAGAGALSNAWAAVKSIGLSQSALAVFQGLTMQFGYVLP